MYVGAFILWVSVLGSGLMMFMLPPLSKRAFKLLLAFGGSYLFGLMLVHILPELFSLTPSSGPLVGLYILIGVFMQLFLDFFSGGIAHGHVADGGDMLDKSLPSLLLVGALCMHALLDGVLLGMPIQLGTHAHAVGGQGLLLGMILHKIPVALTLTTVLKGAQHQKVPILTCLVLFALASPIGWAITVYLHQHAMLAFHTLMGLYALSTGSLLHISTTILFESNPDHHINIPRLLACLLGALLAVGLTCLQGGF